ncbi:MAG: DUF433 domain-containing protein [Candidatus Rokubacteria bacterium]|nr:DUF433 domain-containing protein [Candidatus Rokubacteria bacterium]
MVGEFKLYGTDDPRDIPAYGMSEASRYLGIPVSTLRSWTVGQPYRFKGREHFFAPVIEIADPSRRFLSFWNLFEAYICDALRHEHNISLQKIRAAIQLVKKIDRDSKHPLAEAQFATAGLELFIEEYEHIIGTSSGQLGIRAILERYLKRVDRDKFGRVARLYPFTRSTRTADSPRVVVIDPLVLFGRPVISGTRIATAVVYERWKAGESVPNLADDYQRLPDEIEEALRCEHTSVKAA